MYTCVLFTEEKESGKFTDQLCLFSHVLPPIPLPSKNYQQVEIQLPAETLLCFLF